MSGHLHIPSPPDRAVALLRRAAPPDLLEVVEGDLREAFAHRAATDPAAARRHFWKEVLLVCLWHGFRRRPPAYEQARGPIMLKNYLLVTLRNLRKQKGHTFINLAGLAIGMAVSMLILLYVHHVLTFDAFHEHADDLYMLHRDRPTPEGAVPVWDTWYPMLTEVLNEYPAVVGGVRLLDTNDWVRYEDARFRQNISFTDSSLFSVFSYPLEVGDPATVLREPNAVVLSREAALRFFGDADPIGQTLNVGFERDYVVTGVLGDIPPNSSYDPDLIARLESLPFVDETGWQSSYLFTFVRLAEGTDPRALEAQFPAFVDKFFLPEERGDMHLLPMRDFNDAFDGRRRYAYVLLAVAVGILLIAAINFTNLALARSIQRAREVGMRKVMGATRNRLIGQFMGESVLLSAVAFALGLATAIALLPTFSGYVAMELEPGAFFTPARIGGLVLLWLIVAAVAGSYPAFYLSALNPVATLKGAPSRRPGRALLRNGLVVVQFALSIILLVGIGVMYRQVDYMKSRDLSFEKDHALVIPVSTRDFPDEEAAVARISAFEDQLAGLAGVRSTALSASVPGRYGGSYTLVRPADQADRAPLDWRFAVVDDHYFDTYGMTFAEGRNFDRDRGTDRDRGVILNEAALRIIGWESAGGKRLLMGDDELDVIGVVEDFNYQSLQSPVEPVLHFYGGEAHPRYRFITARLDARTQATTIEQIRSAWQTFEAMPALDYFFVDEAFNQQYETEESMSAVMTYAAGLAALIACLGLLGITSLTLAQRTREIGVRKALGASMGQMLALLAGEHVRLVGLAFLLAVPVSYVAMHRWLEDFAYRTTVSPLLILGVGAAAVALAVATVAYQCIRAARTTPADALRYS